MAELVPDIIEQILVRSDVRDLIRCKSVCKSWKSLVSDPHFIKTHLNHNYNKNCNNRDIGHTRVTIYLLPDGFMFPEDTSIDLVGSANGLVCTNNMNAEFVVANPCTREMKVTELPEFSYYCFGFGYDKYTDDYKIVAGFRKGEEDQTCFQVFSLKSNLWKVIGDVKYKFNFCNRSGILCNGALHWVMYQKRKAVILSFDLSQEDFKEIPQPKDTFYQSVIGQMNLGTVEECLCLYPRLLIPNKIWMLKKYNVMDSWGIMGRSQECELNRDVLRFFKQLKNNGVPYDRSSDRDILFFNTYKFIGAPIFVQSLISPHICHRNTRL